MGELVINQQSVLDRVNGLEQVMQPVLPVHLAQLARNFILSQEETALLDHPLSWDFAQPSAALE